MHDHHHTDTDEEINAHEAYLEALRRLHTAARDVAYLMPGGEVEGYPDDILGDDYPAFVAGLARWVDAAHDARRYDERAAEILDEIGATGAERLCRAIERRLEDEA